MTLPRAPNSWQRKRSVPRGSVGGRRKGNMFYSLGLGTVYRATQRPLLPHPLTLVLPPLPRSLRVMWGPETQEVLCLPWPTGALHLCPDPYGQRRKGRSEERPPNPGTCQNLPRSLRAEAGVTRATRLSLPEATRLSHTPIPTGGGSATPIPTGSGGV